MSLGLSMNHRDMSETKISYVVGWGDDNVLQ